MLRVAVALAVFFTPFFAAAQEPAAPTPTVEAPAEASAPLELTPEERDMVTAAIAKGHAKKAHDLMSRCTAIPFGRGGFAVWAGGRSGLVAYESQAATQRYLPFTPDDVTPEMWAPVITILAEPLEPTYNQLFGWQTAPPITHAVLKHKQRPDQVLQPLTFGVEPREWSNAAGGKWQGTAVRATFDLAAFRTLPPGDVDIVLISDSGEWRCKIGVKDRAKISR